MWSLPMHARVMASQASSIVSLFAREECIYFRTAARSAPSTSQSSSKLASLYYTASHMRRAYIFTFITMDHSV